MILFPARLSNNISRILNPHFILVCINFQLIFLSDWSLSFVILAGWLRPVSRAVNRFRRRNLECFAKLWWVFVCVCEPSGLRLLSDHNSPISWLKSRTDPAFFLQKCYESKQFKIGLKLTKNILGNPQFAEHGGVWCVHSISNCISRVLALWARMKAR